jgi:hypothetical protein
VKSVENDKCYKNLKKFCDIELSELEYGLGSGARNETTHVVSRSTWYLSEFLDEFELGNNKLNIRREDELKLVKKHYLYLRNGVENTYDVIINHFDEIYYNR